MQGTNMQRRMIAGIFSLLAAMCAWPVHAGETAKEEPMLEAMQQALQDCDRTQMAMNLCASHRFGIADKALNAQYQETLKRKQVVADKRRLRDAQRAWLAFRDKDCLASAGPREESGSIWPLLHYSCLHAHTERRIEDLKLQACGTEGCAP